MDVNRRLNEIRYLTRRAMDLAATEGDSSEPWAKAARNWNYISEASRQAYDRSAPI